MAHTPLNFATLHLLGELNHPKVYVAIPAEKLVLDPANFHLNVIVTRAANPNRPLVTNTQLPGNYMMPCEGSDMVAPRAFVATPFTHPSSFGGWRVRQYLLKHLYEQSQLCRCLVKTYPNTSPISVTSRLRGLDPGRTAQHGQQLRPEWRAIVPADRKAVLPFHRSRCAHPWIWGMDYPAHRSSISCRLVRLAVVEEPNFGMRTADLIFRETGFSIGKMWIDTDPPAFTERVLGDTPASPARLWMIHISNSCQRTGTNRVPPAP